MTEVQQEAWKTAPDYGRSLSGFNVNLLVRDVARAVAFQTEVPGAALPAEAEAAQP